MRVFGGFVRVRVGDGRRRAGGRSRWPPRSRRPRTAGRWCRCRPIPRSGRCSPGRGTRGRGSSSRRRAWRTTAGSSPRPAGRTSLTVAVRPSQDLVFSPLAATANGGASWSTGGPINAAVAASPDAFAAVGSHLAALLSDGAIETSSDAGATWSTIAKPGAIAASPAAKGCGGAVRVTSISFGTTGTRSARGRHLRDQRYRRDVLLLSWRGLAAGEPAGVRAARAAYRRDGARAGQVWADRAVARGRLVRVRAALEHAAPPSRRNWDKSAPLPASGSITASGTLPLGGAWVLLSGGRAATISGRRRAAGAAVAAAAAGARAHHGARLRAGRRRRRPRRVRGRR